MGMLTAGKIYERTALAQQADIWRRQGLTLVMTNGCFDLLHAGHILSLEHARAQGDVLIVAVNSDESVRRLKGPDRPVNREADRATVLAALSCVDAVTIFAEETAHAILLLIRPDIYVKGGDNNPDTIPERACVENYGGRLVLAPYLPGRSTTGLITSVRG